MRARVVLVGCVSLALVVGVATASAGGGNSDASRLCRDGGWQILQQADGSAFNGQGEYISYGAHSGSGTQLFDPSLVANPTSITESTHSTLTGTGFHPSSTGTILVEALCGATVCNSSTNTTSTNASGGVLFFVGTAPGSCAFGITAGRVTFTDAQGVHASTTVTLTCT